jgi:hypothetical protein
MGKGELEEQCRDVACYVWKLGKLGEQGELGKRIINEP